MPRFNSISALTLTILMMGCGRVRYVQPHDTGVVVDAARDTGAQLDAVTVDVGPVDAGSIDAGFDAGSIDSGTLDGGVGDTGRDAGPDTSVRPACAFPTATDSDGNIYNTVAIGAQCWFASNLRVGIRVPLTTTPSDNGLTERFCYGDAASCTDASLYTWDEAMRYADVPGARGLCPLGWHIPSDADWQALERFLGMSESDIAMFDFRGTSEGVALLPGGASHFEALTVGILADTGTYFGGGTEAFFWSSNSALAGANAVTRRLTEGNPQVQRYGYAQTGAFSVRCLED